MAAPTNYQRFSTEQTKNLALVVKIEGVSDVITSRAVATKILYGDPIRYGDPGLVYGGLRPYVNADGSTFRDYLSIDQGSLTISQKLESELGRASISNMTLAFIDKDGFFTEIMAPGVVLDDVLGKQVEVFLGYAEISYPQDYIRIFRGFVSAVDCAAGFATMQLSDPNMKKRQQLFFTAKTRTTASITAGTTSIPVASNADFYVPILGPDGSIDPAVKCYIQIEEEWIRTQPGAGSTFGSYLDPESLLPTGPDRGARGTTAASHPSGADVSAAVEISDSAIPMALKLMLSGWNGPWISDQPLQSIGPYPDPNAYVNTTNQIILPPKVDARADYGLVIGDWAKLTGSEVESGNNNLAWYQITGFLDLNNQPNRIILVSGTLFKEGPTPATVAFRSQYDTYPVSCGLKMTPKDIDVQGHIDLQNTFLASTGVDYTFFITDTEDSGKSFIEEQIYRPVGAYSLTRRGLCSASITKPPIADQNLVFLDETNILNPEQIRPSRAVNGRLFYNEIDFSFDEDDEGNFTSVQKILDSESLSQIGLSSVLSIEARGLRTENGAQTYLERLASRFLTRYKRGAVVIPVTVNWQTGNQIEAGDVVALRDGGTLQIPNFATGKRDLGTQLYEVIERSLNIKSGNVQLKLLGLLGVDISDRYATWSPSSLVAAGSTAGAIQIQDSFGALYPGNEMAKWQDFIGETLLVHSQDYSVQGECVLTGFNPTDTYQMQVSGLGFTPLPGYIVDVANYPDTTDPEDALVFKKLFMFWTPSVAVASGISDTSFTVDPSDIGKFLPGARIRIHNEDFSVDSGENDIIVDTVDAGTNAVNTKGSIGFTPESDQTIELIGFRDGGGAYRWI